MVKNFWKSLDWVLTHIEKYGDTDIFPLPFEYKIIIYFWDNKIKEYLLKQDFNNWTIRDYRRLLTQNIIMDLELHK